MERIVKKRNVVVGNSVRALIYAYKKNLPLIVSSSFLQQPFFNYLDYSLYYTQFSIHDSEPIILNTNKGNKIFGPPEKYIWDLLIYYMILGGHCYGYGRERQIKIEGDKITITYPKEDNQIIFAKKIFVFELGDIVTDFSTLDSEEYELYDFFQYKNRKRKKQEYEVQYVDDAGPLKEIWDLEESVAAVYKGLSSEDLESANLTSFMSTLIVQSHLKPTLAKDLEHSHREIRYVPKQKIFKTKNKFVRFPTIGMERLLSMKKAPQNHIGRMEFFLKWSKKIRESKIAKDRAEYIDE